jgi:GxxExxY protein
MLPPGFPERRSMQINEISGHIIDAAFHIHRELGPGLLEHAYQTVLAHELRSRGLEVECNRVVPIRYRGVVLDEGFRADLIVLDQVVVELKSVEKLAPVHAKQLLTYLRLMDRRLGLLINFGESLLKDGIHRVANGLKT